VNPLAANLRDLDQHYIVPDTVEQWVYVQIFHAGWGNNWSNSTHLLPPKNTFIVEWTNPNG